jgi:hypothetical protein
MRLKELVTIPGIPESIFYNETIKKNKMGRHVRYPAPPPGGRAGWGAAAVVAPFRARGRKHFLTVHFVVFLFDVVCNKRGLYSNLEPTYLPNVFFATLHK